MKDCVCVLVKGHYVFVYTVAWRCWAKISFCWP